MLNPSNNWEWDQLLWKMLDIVELYPGLMSEYLNGTITIITFGSLTAVFISRFRSDFSYGHFSVRGGV